MIKKYLRKAIALATVTMSIMAFNPIGASAEWKQDNTGWWYTEGNSWATGWRQISDKWYYFNSNGYMAHDTTIDGYNIGSDGTWVENNTSTSVINKSDTSTEGNQNSNSDSFDVNVSIKYKINIADKIKGTSPNIIKATRQAMFDTDCFFAKLNHYNTYTINNDVLIFDVKEKGMDTWEVDFYEKKSDDKEYDTIGYSCATVEKQKDGSYIGTIIHSSPCMPIGETY